MSIPRSLPTSVAGALILAFLMATTSACMDSHAATVHVEPLPIGERSGPSCNALVDTSGSVANLDVVWSQVRRELTHLVLSSDCVSLRVFTFDIDGWNWTPLVEVAIPAARSIDAPSVPAELGDAKNFGEAIKAKQLALAASARRAHEETVIAALRKLDVVDTHLEGISSKAGSDPIGVLRRLARTPGANDVFIVVTDMADTGLGSGQSMLAAPASPTQVLVLLAPAFARDAAHVGIPVASADQYENRVKLLRTIAPWVAVEPFFATGYADLLERRVEAQMAVH